jgi:hypothetical protein
MKKLKLKALELGAGEVLTRAQLKKVVGGGACGKRSNGTFCRETLPVFVSGVCIDGKCVG